jgi:hypothetical protein
LKEHAGGAPDVGHIHLSSWEEESFTVPVEHFKFDELDKPEAHIIEAVKRGEEIGPLMQAIIDRVSATRCAVKIACLISLILEAPKPRMIVHQIMWATGMTTMDGAHH